MMEEKVVTVNQDELIIQQQRQIEKEISESTKLINDLQTISSLNSEYNDDPVYISKVKDLASKYKAMRKIRPDGNCFFRAFAYSYLEYLINHKDEFEVFKELAINSKEKLVNLGFPQFTIEDFHDTFLEVIQKVTPTEESEHSETEKENLKEELLAKFNNQGYSDYVVVYLRLITSGHLQEGSDFYQHFIDGNCTMEEFCHQDVEPMYKESDHIHIIAICTALNVGVRVEYMDRGDGDQVIAHDFPDNSNPKVYLLYRPGHYDILYPN